MKTLFVVTHAESQHHVAGLVGGRYDSDLTARGRRQAARLGDRLHALLPAGAPVALSSSDLKRAQQTAAAIGARLGVPILTTADLREISYGEAEGQPQSWLDERFIHAPADNRLDHRYGLAGAETKREAGARIYRAVARIVAAPAPYQIIVTHGFALTFVVAAWIRMPLAAAGHLAVRSSPGGITHLVEDDAFHNRAIVTVNDTSHLS